MNNKACPDCHAHSGVMAEIKNIGKNQQKTGEKVSMKLFYILIAALLVVFGGIYHMQSKANDGIQVLSTQQAVMQKDIDTLNNKVP